MPGHMLCFRCKNGHLLKYYSLTEASRIEKKSKGTLEKPLHMQMQSWFTDYQESVFCLLSTSFILFDTVIP